MSSNTWFAVNNPPAFQFYVSDYLSSSKVQRMTLEAEGAYIRLLAYSWQDGFIPADIARMAPMCKTTPKRMAILWDTYLRECFVPSAADPDRLVNQKLEGVRQELLEYRHSKSEAGREGGLRSGEARAKQKRSTASVVLEANAKQNEPLQSSSSKGNTEEVRNTSSGPALAERPKDPAFEVFVKAHQEAMDAVYVPKTGDFVQLSALRKAYRIQGREAPPHWTEAVKHYFSSDLSGFTLADLCSKYAMFRNGPVDRYGKLGGKNERESEAQAKQRRTREASSELLRLVDEQNGSGVPAGDQPGDAGDVPAKSRGLAAGST